jgi:hypothetical protein
LGVEAKGVVDDPTEDGVGQRGVVHEFVPVVDRKLAVDDRRSGVLAIFNELQQIAQALGHSKPKMVLMAYPMRCCQLEAMMEERGVATDPVGLGICGSARYKVALGFVPVCAAFRPAVYGR